MSIRLRHIETEHRLFFFAIQASYSDCDIGVSSSFMTELAISTPEDLHEGFPEEDLMPIPSLNVQESSEQVSIQPGTQVAVYIMTEISDFILLRAEAMQLSNVKPILSNMERERVTLSLAEA